MLPIYDAKRGVMNVPQNEPGFCGPVDPVFNRAVAVMELPLGIGKKIEVCHPIYKVRCDVGQGADMGCVDPAPDMIIGANKMAWLADHCKDIQACGLNTCAPSLSYGRQPISPQWKSSPPVTVPKVFRKKTEDRQ